MTPPESAAAALEMKIGSTWLVRVGIVALLTSLVLLAGYLYQNVVPHLGPAGKVALLGLGAGAVAGLGAWLERRARDTNPGLRNYARVVFGGGLAAVYYVLYAAHAQPGLRVIESAWLAGALQLGWAAFMVWLADRRESQTLATFAILLAYFTSAANGVATFTLFSNLALTVAAVYLLRRHRWAAFSFASLLATYGSYAFWRYAGAVGSSDFSHALSAVDSRAGGNFWTEFGFLFLYWLLFTIAVFQPAAPLPVAASGAPAPPALPTRSRATFATLNNGGFFLLSNLLVDAAHPAQLWLHALGFGALLVALGAAWRLLPRFFPYGPSAAEPGRPAPLLELAPATAAAYRLLGIVLITLGLVNRFSGWNLALALAAESVVLLLAAAATPPTAGRRLLPACAVVAGFLCGCVTLSRLHPDFGPWEFPLPDWSAVVLGCAVAAAFLFNAAWSRRTLDRDAAEAARASAVPVGGRRDWLLALPALFSVLGALACLVLLDGQISSATWLRAPALALAAVALTALAYPLRLGALTAAASGLLLAGAGRWLEAAAGPGSAISPWWSALGVIVCAVALTHWWQRQQRFPWPSPAGRGLPHLTQAWLALCAVGIAFVWLQPHFSPPTRLAVWSLLATLVLLYGLVTQAWAIAAASQVFLLAAVALFVGVLLGLTQPTPGRWPTLAPVGATLLVPLLVRYFRTLGEAAFSPAATSLGSLGTMRGIGVGYEALALLLAVAWTTCYVAEPAQFLTLASLGLALFAAGLRWRAPRWLLFGVLPTVLGLALFWAREFGWPRHFFWQDLLALGVLFAQQRIGRVLAPLASSSSPLPGQPVVARVLPPGWTHLALLLPATLTAWRWLTDLLALRAGGSFYLAAGWSLFAAALFAAGLILRERGYRWLGLGVLLVTLGRIVVIDFWQAETLHRILGLLALGAVLLGVGFIYNRYGARLREWL